MEGFTMRRLLGLWVFVIVTMPVHAQNAQAWLEQGKRVGNAGNFQAAIQAFSKAITSDRTFVDAHYWRAQAEIEVGQNDAALAELTLCIHNRPAMTGCFYHRSFLHYRRGNQREAEYDFKYAETEACRYRNSIDHLHRRYERLHPAG
jgi:tetratricopeptide (TPR) repeat protein